MQKITEIKVLHTTKKKQLVNGVETFVEEQSWRYKDVKYVDGIARFGHFLLDRVFMYIFNAIFWVIIGIVVVLIAGTEVFEDESTLNIVDALVSWLFLQPLFYFIFESTMQASPAKAILGRIVVDEYGNKPTLKQIFIRSISRSVPFEPFSCLGQMGWHDTWSNTFVIRKKDLKELKMIQKINEIEQPGNSSQEPQQIV